jgi:hypothetical protein
MRTDAGQQKLPLWTLTAMVVGGMVGAGVFSIPRNFAQATGIYGALIAWTIAGAGMLMLGLVFQTLANRKPDLDAGVYAWFRVAFGSGDFTPVMGTIVTLDRVDREPDQSHVQDIMMQPHHFLENAENCAQLAERAADEPTYNRYKRMEAAWRALAVEQDWLNGAIVRNAKPVKATANCCRDYRLWNLDLASCPLDHATWSNRHSYSQDAKVLF